MITIKHYLQYLKRLKNPGTLTAVVSSGALLAKQFGYHIDTVWLNDTVNALCVIGIALGVLNNPDTSGIDIPGKSPESNQ